MAAPPCRYQLLYIISGSLVGGRTTGNGEVKLAELASERNRVEFAADESLTAAHDYLNHSVTTLYGFLAPVLHRLGRHL